MKISSESNLSVFKLTMIGVGGIIGAGFFLASSLAIKHAGPAILINYLISIFVMSQVLTALAEMSIAEPSEGSFRVYAEKTLGHVFGFLSGWMYWIAGVLIMSSEVTASAIFTRFWFPHVPLWIFSLIFSILIIGVNLMGLKDFSTIESFFSTIKVTALVLFIVFGVLVLSGFLGSSHDSSISNLYNHGGFFPRGISGFLAASLMALFSFGGIVVTGMSVSEAHNPQLDIPRVIRNIITILFVLYFGSLFVVLTVASWDQVVAHTSPFVLILKFVHLPYIDSILNFIILTAALSTMNAAMFAVTGTLFSLAKDNEAPSILKKVNKRGVKIYALFTSSFGLIVAIVMAYFLPSNVYEYITSAAGFMLFLNWIIILFTQLKYRQKFLAEKANLKYRMKGYPYTSWITIGLLLTILGTAFLAKEQMIGLIAGLIIVIIILSVYYIRKLI